MLPFEAAKRLYAYERMQALQAVEALLIIRKGIHSGQRLAHAPDFATMLNSIIDNNLVRGICGSKYYQCRVFTSEYAAAYRGR
jgi:hypothetical protein